MEDKPARKEKRAGESEHGPCLLNNGRGCSHFDPILDRSLAPTEVRKLG